MAAALTTARTGHTAAELRAAASRSRDAAQGRRLLGLASILQGRSRAEAAEQDGMGRQTLRGWVRRCNASGIDGLTARASPGRRPAPSEAPRAEAKALVIAGPDPVQNKVVRWRCAELREEATRRLDVAAHESTTGKRLRQLGLTRLQARPFRPEKAAEAEATFKRASPAWRGRRCGRPRQAPRSRHGSRTRPGSAGTGRPPMRGRRLGRGR